MLLFLTAAVAGAAAQQQPAPDSAIINPGEPINIASQNQVLKSLPGTVNSHLPHGRADIDKLADEMNEHQRAETEKRNHELTAQFNALQQAGGWQQAFLSQLARTRLELPNSNEQLNAAQAFIQNFVFCDRPLIAEQVSEFQTFAFQGAQSPEGTVDKEFIVEPLAAVIINGCNFGAQAGEVRLVLSQDPNNFIPLQINNWGDSSILATLGAHPGIPDQEAQLVIVRADGVQSIPMPVQFFQHRVAQFFNVAANLDAVKVFTSAHTTTDEFRFVVFTDLAESGNSDIAASHYTFCCSSVSGTDTWLFSFKNGWQVPDSEVFRVIGFDSALPTPAQVFARFEVNDGISDCGLFSSGDGGTGAISVINNLVSAPGVSEVQIPWHAGAHCSGLMYFVRITIWGPDGIPFE